LPSEAEWEFASAGGRAELEYPWGSAPPGISNTYAIYDCDYPDASGTCTGAVNIAPVGTAQRGAGPWGQLDLAGNVFQWTLDWYAAPYVDPSNDGAYLAAASTRSLRGGNFIEGTSVLVPEFRYNFDPSERYHGHGVRCARAP
jgi:formylglycine-generating enzyme